MLASKGGEMDTSSKDGEMETSGQRKQMTYPKPLL